MSKKTELVLPVKSDAEQMVIGSVLLQNDAIYKIIDILSPDDFYIPAHATLFQGILNLIRKGQKIDLMTLAEETKIANSLIARCSNMPISANNIAEYARIVRESSLRRNLIRIQKLNIMSAFDENVPIDTLITFSQNSIFNIQTSETQKDDTETIVKKLEETQTEYAEKYKQGRSYIGIPCGIEKIDNLIDGLRPGHVWVVGAWASTGKTMFVMNIIHNVIEQMEAVSVISLEMNQVDLAARIIGIRHGISSARVLKGLNDYETSEAIKEGKLFLRQANLEIHTTYFDIEKIKMLIRKNVYSRKVKLFVIDYVQNILSEKDKREYDLLTQSATDLQALARELGITIIIVSQISNESEKGYGAGAGFKGTGALEAIADLAIKLKRDKEDESPDAEFVPLKIIISKNRHGFTGVIDDYNLLLKSGRLEKRI